MSPVPVRPSEGTALARRIEHAVAGDVCVCVADAVASGDSPMAAWLRVGGGVAGFYSAESAFNGAFGLGFSGQTAAEEVAALVAFYEERGVGAAIGVCPHADTTLLRWLAAYGFLVSGFEAVSYRWLDGTAAARSASDDLPSDISVRIARTDAERALWAELEARGWTEDAPTDDDRAVSRSLASRSEALHLIGCLDGEPAGTAMMTISEGVALLNGDSTLPALRGRGIHSALIGERLRLAADAGCDLAVIEAAPGSASARNQERAGFRMAYTRVNMERPPGGELDGPAH